MVLVLIGTDVAEGFSVIRTRLTALIASKLVRIRREGGGLVQGFRHPASRPC